jgi:hypothetical protein
MTQGDRLSDLLELVLDVAHNTVDVSPAWAASAALSRLGFSLVGATDNMQLVYAAAHFGLRQMAREKLRKHDPVEAAEVYGQEAMQFAGTLQRRYPRKPEQDVEPVYSLRDHLTGADVAYNVDRMRKAGRALEKHANALHAWHVSRISTAA